MTVKDLNSGQEYVSEYFYRDGYYDGKEKEFRGFGEVKKVEYGDASAPTLITSYVFDVGKSEESRKGMIKSMAALNENGTVSPPYQIFEKEDNTFSTKTLLTGLDGETVRYSFISEKRSYVYEGTAAYKLLLSQFNYDNYGNITEELNYGLVDGDDKSFGDDEVLTYTEYMIDEDAWIVDRPSEIHKTNFDSTFVSLEKNYYDTKGNLIRQERYTDEVKMIPVVRNEFDSYGNIIKITDANNHWRDIAYDTVFHTFPVSEAIGELGLSMSAQYDTGFGVMTAYTDFNGNTTTFGYDTFGRLTSIIKPGDSSDLPTQEFAY